MIDYKFRLKVALISVVIALVFILLLTTFLSEGRLAEFLLDRDSGLFAYPFSIQNIMWIIFFVGCGELFVCFLRGSIESKQTGLNLLPEDTHSMLRAKDLGEIYINANQVEKSKQSYLQKLVSRSILQFQSSRSISQANELLNSSLELFQHEIDLAYNMLRYVVWLIPTLGFIGTVTGIAFSLHEATSLTVTTTDPREMLQVMTGGLGVAFYTTLLALIQSAFLVFLMYVFQEKEEQSLNRSGQYCLDNLINRLYESN